MPKFEFAVDMGTSFTSIYQKDTGLVLREPSVVLLSAGKTEKLLAVGSEAKKRIGKAPLASKISFPLSEGTVDCFPLAAKMLESFLKKITPDTVLRPQIKLIMTAPCGSSAKDKKLFSETGYESGAKEVVVVDAPLCTLLGLNIPLEISSPVMIVDIGGGKTDISVVTLNGMITGCSMAIGGNNIDIAIIEYLEGEFGIRTGLLTAEKLKSQVGSLYQNDKAEIEVSGSDAESGTPLSMVVSSKMLHPVIDRYYKMIFEMTAAVLSELPAEVGAEIKNRGIFLTGGGSQIAGISKAMETATGIKINVTEEPSYCTVLGTGKLLTEKKLLQRFLSF